MEGYETGMTAETPAAAQTRNLLRRLLVGARRGVDHAEAAAAVAAE